jgi:hypothetical protein
LHAKRRVRSGWIHNAINGVAGAGQSRRLEPVRDDDFVLYVLTSALGAFGR